MRPDPNPAIREAEPALRPADHPIVIPRAHKDFIFAQHAARGRGSILDRTAGIDAGAGGCSPLGGGGRDHGPDAASRRSTVRAAR
ncbi:hypothetical protein GCM10023094_18460 [Rhodococcus olei]|uniref:Uncharacterized protein n=1 Tax=Rhodococcus olei TaxID=2161675 RepID=A0ABP8NXD4_9NOCA